MMSKLTRFLSIITVLAVIALIVVYVLKNNGKIWSRMNEKKISLITYYLYKLYKKSSKILI